MSNDSILLEAFALGGYRSFGEIQRFEQLAKINLLIGQNNSGKSNILRFLHEILPQFTFRKNQGRLKINPLLDNHFPSQPDIFIGFPIDIKNIPSLQKKITIHSLDCDNFNLVLKRKSEIDQSNTAWIDFDKSKSINYEDWLISFESLSYDEIKAVSYFMHGGSLENGGRDSFIQDIVGYLAPYDFKAFPTKIIPAIRQVGKQGSVSDDFDGEGIIERLVKLQNPDSQNQHDKQKFKAINSFLQTVTDNKSAQIEIPHQRDTILVHMDGKTLPLESLGTGIHEVIILASAATILENHIICMEEPEIHLHPILQKKLVRYLTENTSNQYFISTHSAALMDTPDAEMYHISLKNGQSIVERVTSDRHRSMVCEDLGYHPSDLLQANCVIWVEGPSDRIYLNYWIYSLAPHYIEGIHYSIMFYGGRLASHLSGSDIDEEEIKDFISLRRLNRRGIILIDSDRAKKSDSLNDTKLRLEQEFNQGSGYAWITEGREIENYLPVEQIKSAITASIPSATPRSSFGKYDNLLSITRQNGKKDQAPKTAVARYVVKNYPNTDFSQLNLREQLEKLTDFIQESNPGLILR